MLVFWREWYIIWDHQLWKVLRISCSFYYLVASTACFVHIKIQVLAEREQKIQTEVKEIRKVFYCDLCNKQYKLAVEFEAHLSSYDHNHRKVNGLCWSQSQSLFFDFIVSNLVWMGKTLKWGLQRFKEMKEMHGTSSRDDRKKREQQRQEREMAKFAQMYQSFALSESYMISLFCFVFLSVFLIASLAWHSFFLFL